MIVFVMELVSVLVTFQRINVLFKLREQGFADRSASIGHLIADSAYFSSFYFETRFSPKSSVSFI